MDDDDTHARRQHRRLMHLPVGHPDEEYFYGETDEDDTDTTAD